MDMVIGFIAAVFFVIGLALGVYIIGDSEEFELGVIARPLMAECESKIPRNEHCILMAVRGELQKDVDNKTD